MTGWSPRHQEARRKDFAGAQKRARRQRMTPWPSEAKAWRVLRILNKEGANLRRQANTGPYVFDFAALSRRVLIEIDGRIHDRADVKALDDEKAAYAEQSGYSLVRIANDEIWTNPDAVLDRLRTILFGETALVRTPAPGGGGRGMGRSG